MLSLPLGAMAVATRTVFRICENSQEPPASTHLSASLGPLLQAANSAIAAATVMIRRFMAATLR